MTAAIHGDRAGRGTRCGSRRSRPAPRSGTGADAASAASAPSRRRWGRRARRRRRRRPRAGRRRAGTTLPAPRLRGRGGPSRRSAGGSGPRRRPGPRPGRRRRGAPSRGAGSRTAGGVWRRRRTAVPNGRVRSTAGGRTGTWRREVEVERSPRRPRVWVGVGSSISPSEAGDVVQVAAVGQAAEDELDGGGVPDRVGGVFAPPVAGLGQGLQDGEGGDPGSAAFGHQRGQRRQRGEVGDLVQGEQQRRVEAGPGRGGGEAAGGLGDVLDERGDQRSGRRRRDRRGQQVQRARPRRGTLAGSNPSPGSGSTAARTRGSARAARAWRTPSQIESRVRGSACDGGVEGVGPPVGGVRVPGQDGDGVVGQGRVAATTGTGRRRGARRGRRRAAGSAGWSRSARPRTPRPRPRRPTRRRRPGRGRGPAPSGAPRSRGPATRPSPPGSPARCCGSKTATGPRRRRAVEGDGEGVRAGRRRDHRRRGRRAPRG